MKLFDFPGSCSIGIHALLEETGASYELEVVDLASFAQKSDAYKSLNPKGKVPALLRDDGTVLTEFPAIAFWLAKTYPEARLIGSTLEQETRALESLEYIVGSVHMRGITFVIMPMKFLPDDKTAQKTLRAFGRNEVKKGVATLSDTLGDKPYLLGDFTIADAALFYLLRMVREVGIDLPENLDACLDRVSKRPAFASALSRFEALRGRT
ncbi:MAG: glutathione S-transferase family protein [Pelagimonas sp.]|uniref:glutathione S-transferase family protein n=1 Tax=Pelagimonas sp. TaxID=2073170 RepID=UPI003D6C1F30